MTAEPTIYTIATPARLLEVPSEAVTRFLLYETRQFFWGGDLAWRFLKNSDASQGSNALLESTYQVQYLYLVLYLGTW